MAFEKITENVENISLLPNDPTLIEQALKAEFDKGNKTIKTKFNKLVDDLNELDLPEVCETVGNSTTYSTEEKTIGTWIDGKTLYRKVISVGSLPNNTTDLVAHGISNLYQIIKIEPKWYDTTDGWFAANRIDSQTIKITFKVTTNFIKIEAIGTNWSTRTNNCTVTLEYTKN